MKELYEEYGTFVVVAISVFALSALLFSFFKPDNPLGQMVQQLLTAEDV